MKRKEGKIFSFHTFEMWIAEKDVLNMFYI